jgi:M6 family metalloprotease-like protein
LALSLVLRHETLAAATPGEVCAPYRITDTLVILAETTDTAGMGSLHRVQMLAQAAEWYYAQNSYSREKLCFTFLDADGAQGEHDWYNVGPSLAAYRGEEHAFALEALARALAAADLPEVVQVARAVVVCPAGQQMGARVLDASAFAHASRDYVAVSRPGGNRRIYLQDVVLVSEEDDLGTWVHELGHTLASKVLSPAGLRLTDRYSYYNDPTRRYGDAGPWDVMGTGSRWGNPVGTSPTHMCSYTKVAAGWLHYAPAVVGQDYPLVALEHQRAGDAVLTFDDPASDDPQAHYILEARDADAFFGAPASGVMLYHVTYDHQANHAVVNTLGPQGGMQGNQPTLHGGVAVYAGAGIRVLLLAESFSPYRATVRVEHLP